MADDAANFDFLFSDGPSLSPTEAPAGNTVTVPAVPAGDLAMGPFEAADRLDSSIALWSSPLKSIDAEILPEKPVIDGRARDMLRNDAYIQGGSNLHKDNIVGSHYLLNSRPSSKVVLGAVDDVWEDEFQSEVEEKWELYSDSSDNWIDATRSNNFTQLVRLGVGVHFAAGEMLSTVEYIKDDGSPFNTAIQFVDLDRLSTSPLSRNDADVREGIRFNKRGAPVAYQIRTQHPSDYGPMFGTLGYQLPQWKEVALRKPWGRLQVIHLFETLRPDQSRGLTDLVTALKATKIGHTWRDLNVQHAVTQAMYAAAITSELPSEQVFSALGGGALTADKTQELVTNYATGYLSSVAQYAGTNRGLQIDGVKIPHLYPGTKLELLSPGKSGLQPEFESSLLRYIAASMGVSYEQLSRDYTKTNYSSARAAMNETWKFMQARKKMIADKFATICYRLWLEEAINKNEISAIPKRRAGILYTNDRLNLKFDAISKCDWIGASRGQIDEYKETQAAVLRITSGLSTAEDELARLGKDWRKVYRQLKREMALRETLGLMFTGTDPAVLAAQAATDAAQQNQGASNNGN
jgi:lambda family phage portal protein